MDEASLYLRDLGGLLWSEAEQAKRNAADDFERGRAFGLYQAVSLMQQQAVAFGLAPADVGLEGRGADALLDQE